MGDRREENCPVHGLPPWEGEPEGLDKRVRDFRGVSFQRDLVPCTTGHPILLFSK